ncbi:MAG TPA: hypothetical protein VGV59_05250 [Pyrinomonadaceae bacterium]|nr:hypothetical protein [Pyrinomonadaceae bacterium]
MAQLGALLWLKWRLLRNTLRDGKAATGRVATALGLLAGFGISLAIAALLGVGIYAMAWAERESGGRLAGTGIGELSSVFIVWIFIILYLMWAIVPLGLGGGSRFDAGRLLLYPVSLRKLFAIDWLSELLSLSSVFAAPVVVGVAVGAGAARGALWAALLAALCAIVCGVALAKFLSTMTGMLARSKRTRGETLLAVFGAAIGIFGAFFGRLAPALAERTANLPGLRWTPPGAAAAALSEGLEPGGGLSYASALATLTGYTLLLVAVTYWAARRTALGMGGAKRGRVRTKTGEPATGARRYAGWQLPFVSPQLAAVVEKELRYAVRNAQMRVIAVMGVALTIAIRLAPLRPRGGRDGGEMFGFWATVESYAEGAGTVFGVLYITMLLSPLTTNLFGFEDGGMRTLLLAPVERRTFLVGKNLSHMLIALVLVTVGVVVNGVVFGDLNGRVLVFAALAFVTFATLFALAGNWLSLNFPKRVQFGKRMNRTGMAGLLLLPLFVLLLVPPFVAVLVAYAAQSVALKYVILAVFAALSATLYVALIGAQGRSLEAREIEIMEAVTGRGGDDAGQILG